MVPYRPEGYLSNDVDASYCNHAADFSPRKLKGLMGHMTNRKNQPPTMEELCQHEGH